MLEDMKSVVREPIILVLDPQVQMLPFERFPIMRDQEVYRMPSVESIFNIMKKHSESQIPFIDPKQSFVLLNSDQSFPNAEELLLPQLTRSRYFPVKTLKNVINCAAAFLMGCANGSSKLRGYYPPYCVPLSYLYKKIEPLI
ncbi:hypothetical protein M0R45_021354 [Rubus argutus]|uniref:Uncharacterized protein n=1 Tax=Rubus argutus TaxID=59490 RepID=A0AAW1XEQ5_RUBAR